jgi:predicted transcriptional regulator
MTTLQRFRLALAVSGVSATQFAKKHRIARQTLYSVIGGKGVSKRVSAAVERFIASHPAPRHQRAAA